jgi:hypothetical protein
MSLMNSPFDLLLRDVLPKVERGLEVRIVYRVKEPADLEITDLDALKAVEDWGCNIRYSTGLLHAKLLVVARVASHLRNRQRRSGRREGRAVLGGQQPARGSRLGKHRSAQ